MQGFWRLLGIDRVLGLSMMISPTNDDLVSVAKRLGADKDKVRFEAKLGKIAKAKRKVS